jgi:thiamine-phosphate pyrophosphorylase
VSEGLADGEPACRLYLITPNELFTGALDLEAFTGQLAAALDGGDVACVQLRLKEADDATFLRAARRLAPIVQERGAAFLVNDRPDIAADSGADGVHIGQEDAAYAEARRRVGADAIVGVTCHDSRHLAMVAAEQGADYVAFGAFHPTTTKDNPKGRAEPELLSWWSELMTTPCVAIGGITAENCAPLVAAGADFIAVASAVWRHPGGPGAGVAALNGAIAEALAERKPA